MLVMIAPPSDQPSLNSQYYSDKSRQMDATAGEQDRPNRRACSVTPIRRAGCAAPGTCARNPPAGRDYPEQEDQHASVGEVRNLRPRYCELTLSYCFGKRLCNAKFVTLPTVIAMLTGLIRLSRTKPVVARLFDCHALGRKNAMQSGLGRCGGSARGNREDEGDASHSPPPDHCFSSRTDPCADQYGIRRGRRCDALSRGRPRH